MMPLARVSWMISTTSAVMLAAAYASELDGGEIARDSVAVESAAPLMVLQGGTSRLAVEFGGRS